MDIQNNPILYERHMSDIFCKVKTCKIEQKLKFINKLHHTLSFTYEVELSGTLAF